MFGMLLTMMCYTEGAPDAQFVRCAERLGGCCHLARPPNEAVIGMHAVVKVSVRLVDVDPAQGAGEADVFISASTCVPVWVSLNSCTYHGAAVSGSRVRPLL